MTKIEIIREDEKATHILKAIRLIDDGVEIEPVVRCKDCKDQGHCEVEELLIHGINADNPYCSYGEREDNG